MPAAIRCAASTEAGVGMQARRLGAGGGLMSRRTLGRSRIVSVVAVAVIALSVVGCSRAQIHTTVLASDAYGGRDDGTAGSVLAQNYLIAQLRYMGATGLNTAATGDAAFKQRFPSGTNILGVIRGTELPDEYVIIGGHYDHLGSGPYCQGQGPGDTICNGATDNAAGSAVTLEVGYTVSQLRAGPRRSVILAFWDREEDGLFGSEHYTRNPIVPLAKTIAYLNFDIQGANLLPSLRTKSFAIGGESGGTRLTDAARLAIGTTLDTKIVSSIFGQGLSDYVNFNAVGVPNIFFSDATGPCYHTVDDEVAIVNWDKLNQQVGIASRLALDMINGSRPSFVASPPLATYGDAVAIRSTVNAAFADIARFTSNQQAQLVQFRDFLNAVVADGPGQFDDADLGPLLGGAANAISILTTGVCDGFLAP